MLLLNKIDCRVMSYFHKIFPAFWKKPS